MTGYRSTTFRYALLAAAAALPTAALTAQTAPASPATPPAAASAPAAQPAPSTVPAVSGTMFGNYQYNVGGPRTNQNQFTLDRVYLTVRGTVAPRTTFRVTSDVFQSGDANGWTVRMKYAYLNYDLNAGKPWATALRAGMLQTVAIEHIESFWPRWLGTTAIDRHGWFSSADVGVAAQVALPSKLGEVYTHVVNGSSYTRRETDRFKDYAARVSLTPFAAKTSGLLSTATLTGWMYQGATGSRFAADTARQVGDAMTRDRWGVFAGIRDPRLTVGLEHAHRTDESESGANTLASPRRVTEVDGRVTSAFTVVRPLAWAKRTKTSPFGLVARYDRVTPDTAADGRFHYLFAGVLYDVNNRMSLALDYQEQLGTAGITPAPSRAWFLNFVLNY